ERDQEAHQPQRGERPLVDQHRRDHAEGHHVGQAVQLHPELALGAGEPSHAPVETVEEHGEEDRQRCLVELGGAGLSRAQGQGIEPAEDRRDGEQVGQDELELVQLHRSPAPATDGPLPRPWPPGRGTLASWTWDGPCSPPPCWPSASRPTCSPCARTTGCAARVRSWNGSGPWTGRVWPFTAAVRPSAASSSRCSSVTDLPPITSTSTSTPLIPSRTSSPLPGSRSSASTGAAPGTPGRPTSGSASSTTPTISSPRTDRPSWPMRSSAPEPRAPSGWAIRWARSWATACWEARMATASGECARSGPRSSSAT